MQREDEKSPLPHRGWEGVEYLEMLMEPVEKDILNIEKVEHGKVVGVIGIALVQSDI